MSMTVAKELVHLGSWFGDCTRLVDVGFDAYYNDPLLQHAGDALLIKIGESANRLRRNGWTDTRPDIHWDRIVGNRNVHMHQYDVVNREQAWQTLRAHVPELSTLLSDDIAIAQALVSGFDPQSHPERTAPPWSPSAD